MVYSNDQGEELGGNRRVSAGRDSVLGHHSEGLLFVRIGLNF